MAEAAVLPDRAALVPPNLRPGRELLAEGRALARDWRVGRTPFLERAGVGCEADYKRAAAAAGRIMQHAHIGFRSVQRTVGAIAQVHETCDARGVTVDRFGITLDWSMGYPAGDRGNRRRGTGIVLGGPEDFARITGAAPAAAHFGDFMLGLPGALDNTKHALAAGATAIGNLGQYFTFRLPDWDDDVATTEATVRALGLIAAQPVDVMVHSNLDDGFAGLFADMSATLGMVLIETHIVETLIGARTSHCFGHHFTAPAMRLAFHRALAMVTDGPGTMIFGNTVSYRSTAGGNFASLASYLQADIWALRRHHTGHAINPVPVSENERIPDIDEIIEAQIFAARLVEHASESFGLVSFEDVDRDAERPRRRRPPLRHPGARRSRRSRHRHRRSGRADDRVAPDRAQAAGGAVRPRRSRPRGLGRTPSPDPGRVGRGPAPLGAGLGGTDACGDPRPPARERPPGLRWHQRCA